jgi:hypothetical protein
MPKLSSHVPWRALEENGLREEKRTRALVAAGGQ